MGNAYLLFNYQKKISATVLSLTSAFFISCTSVSPKTAHVPTPNLDRFPEGEGPAKHISPEEKVIIQELRAIEASFARRNCAQIRQNTKRLEFLKVNPKSPLLPVSTALALFICDAEANPSDRVKNAAALAAIDLASNNLFPWVSQSFLENLKAERYFALKDTENALKSRKNQRQALVAQDEAIALVDTQILELSPGNSALSDRQKQKFKEAAALAAPDDKLFASVALYDELLGSLPVGAARTLVLSNRARVVGHIEQLFAFEVSEFEDKKSTGREAEAKDLAAHLYSKYPSKAYAARIDSMLGAPKPTAPAATESPQPPIPSSQLTETQLVDKALADGKVALDAGNFQLAVETLDALPEPVRTDRTRRFRRDAAEAHVRDMRIRVRDIYGRSTTQADPQTKMDALKQCRQILETILTKYPDTPGRSGVERNLKTIIQEIDAAGKTQK